MVLERIKQYIDSKGIAVAAFERSIGMSNASFGKSLKNGGAIGSDKLENILTIYPDLSPLWLMCGEGEMLRTAPSVSRNEESLPHSALSQFLATIQQQSEEIGRLKAELAETKKHAERLAALVDTDASARVG